MRPAARNILKIPLGFGTISGKPEHANGHFYLTVYPFPEGGGSDAQAHSTQIYDIEAVTGSVKKIGDIDEDGYQFVIHDGVVRYAYGEDNNLKEHVYYRSGPDDHWNELARAVVGASFAPQAISADGTHLYSIASASGGPNAFVDQQSRWHRPESARVQPARERVGYRVDAVSARAVCGRVRGRQTDDDVHRRQPLRSRGEGAQREIRRPRRDPGQHERRRIEPDHRRGQRSRSRHVRVVRHEDEQPAPTVPGQALDQGGEARRTQTVLVQGVERKRTRRLHHVAAASRGEESSGDPDRARRTDRHRRFVGSVELVGKHRSAIPRHARLCRRAGELSRFGWTRQGVRRSRQAADGFRHDAGHARRPEMDHRPRLRGQKPRLRLRRELRRLHRVFPAGVRAARHVQMLGRHRRHLRHPAMGRRATRAARARAKISCAKRGGWTIRNTCPTTPRSITSTSSTCRS